MLSCGQGAETLIASGIPNIHHSQVKDAVGPFWAQLDVEEHYCIDGTVNRTELFNDPTGFELNFMEYAPCAHLYIAGHYYDSRASYIFTREERKVLTNIKYIADISCDMMVQWHQRSDLQP